MKEQTKKTMWKIASPLVGNLSNQIQKEIADKIDNNRDYNYFRPVTASFKSMLANAALYPTTSYTIGYCLSGAELGKTMAMASASYVMLEAVARTAILASKIKGSILDNEGEGVGSLVGKIVSFPFELPGKIH